MFSMRKSLGNSLKVTLAYFIFWSSASQAGVALSKFDPDNMRFRKACEPAYQQIVIAGVGDLLMHGPVQRTAAASNFKSLWNSVLPILSQAQVMYVNLETPVAPGLKRNGKIIKDPGEFDNNAYTSYPLFNTSPKLVYDLKASGFDVVSTANNHSVDRGSLGVDLTIETLRKARLAFTGTVHSKELDSSPFYTFVRESGWNLAFLACTWSNNGNPDRKHQVLHCFDDKSKLLNLVEELSKMPTVDAVIVTPHWGMTEYTHNPDQRNLDLGHELIDAGAAAVIGTHPHVLQPWEKYTTKDGREGFIAYSTGNFISNQQQWQRRMGLSVFVGLSKDSQGNVWINGVRYHPLWTSFKPARVESLPKSKSVSRAWDLLPQLVGKDRYLDAESQLVTNFECY
ncbi:MAG: CapA family protein [Bdellovibrionales bacterium]|nr:CapA family protein [Bdellovibrionales bacterium]